MDLPENTAAPNINAGLGSLGCRRVLGKSTPKRQMRAAGEDVLRLNAEKLLRKYFVKKRKTNLARTSIVFI